jgi:predicted PurR-regulated permease PerM
MATNRVSLPGPEQLSPQEVTVTPEAITEAREQEQTRKTNSSIQASSAALVIIALGIVLVICYLAKLVLVTLLVSILVAFMLEPLVTLLERVRIPRSVGALLAILLMLGLGYLGTYFFYNRAVSFIEELPKYSHKVRGTLAHVRQKTSQLEQTTKQIMPQNAAPKNSVPVTVQNANSSGLLTEHLAAVTEVALTMTFIPFLVYFMLSWQEHARTKTVQLFRPEHRTTAYVTLGQISLMMRSFITGNFIIGLFMGICSVIVFGFLKLPYFYFIGFISGFLSLMPYLGIALAIVPPVAAGIGTLSTTGLLIIGLTVLGLHLLSMNVLYPKVIGKRLQLNPLVVTMSLLIWGWIWGAMGLILAVPMMGAIKIVCDHVGALRPFGAWMGE